MKDHNIARYLAISLSPLLLVCLLSASAHAAVVSNMATPAASNASIKVTITVQTSLGNSTDDDTKIMATSATATAAFLPNDPAFTSTQFNALQINLANSTFNFQFFCLPFIGCQNLNVTMSDLSFTLVEPTCSPIGPTGNIAFNDAVVHVTGSYSTTGISVTSGTLDNTASGSITGRITNPSAGNVKLDQLAMATQTIVADPADLPAPLTGLTITVQPTLTNTTMSGPYSASAESFDADGDGQFDFCDICTDTDSDGFGDPGFPHNTCPTPDNCPAVVNPDQLDTDNNGIGDACEPAPPCPADIAPKGGNNVIDVDDLLAIINTWGKCADCPTDIAPPGGNNVVDVDDLLKVINAWGACK